MRIREAQAGDAPGMAAVQAAIAAARASIGRAPAPADAAGVAARYLDHPDRIRCTLAEEGGRILGFQSLRLARAGNPYGTPPGWGIIGTHVAPDAAGRGIGRALFAATTAAARAAGLQLIDACIGAQNAAGQAFYEALGFRDWATGDGTVSKLCIVPRAAPAPHARIARASADLAALMPFWRDGLGLAEIGRFTGHEGYDGVMLGLPGADWHLEFTCHPHHPPPPPPGPESLLVLYRPEPADWTAAVARMTAQGFAPVPAANPYWDRWGVTFEDPEGWRAVLARRAWD